MEENKTQKPTNEEVKAISKIPILQTKKLRKWLVIVFMLLTIIVTYVVYRGKYLETIEMGEQYLSVFWKNTLNLAMTFGINFLVLYFIMYITNKGIHKGLVPFFEDEKKPIAKMPNKSIAFIVSILISFFVSKPLLEKAMVCFNCTGFGRVDPVFGYDIGFFIFVEPFLQFIINYLLKIVIGLAIYTAVYYILAFHFYFDGVDRQTLKNSKLIKKTCHYGIIIAVLYAVLLVIETFNVGLQKFLVLGKGEEAYGLWGAGLNEVTIKMWGYRILGIVIVLAIIFAVHYFKKSNTKKVLISLLCVPSYLIAMLITLVLFETIFVNPNELDKESKYITANIDSTKQAYGIDIEEVNLSENKTITTNMLEENSNVVDNISIVNKNNVLKNLNTLQTNKGYYTYRTAQIAKYEINGKTQLVYVSPREIAGSNTYNNKTYEYTHGYGTVLTSASKVDEKGNLVYLQKDFIKNSNDVINIKEPRIYFGLETNNTAVTNSNSKKEFDYPLINSTKAENAENVYRRNSRS